MKSFFRYLGRRYPTLFKWRQDLRRIGPALEVLEIQNRLLALKQEALACNPQAVPEAPGLPAPDGFRHETLYVLGSGPSLRELSVGEKEFLRGQPVLAMNRYLPFWELVGIWPQYVFLADTAPLGYRTFLEYCLLSSRRERESPVFLLDKVFRPFCLPNMPTVTFHRYDHRNYEDWATSLDQPLYFVRGSLSSLLNLLCLLRLARKVVLVGIDLNRGGAFYDDQTENRPELFNPLDLAAEKQDLHETARRSQDEGRFSTTVLDGFPTILSEYGKAGMTLASAGKTSLLVEEGLCDYEPILKEGETP